MKKPNHIAWIIVALFAILLGYTGSRSLHFSSPILFIVIAIMGSAILILSLSTLKNID